MFERVAPEQFDTIPEIPEPAENRLLCGHRAVGDMLAAAHGSGRLHHAILLAGPTGIGKATLAFHLARHLLSGARGEMLAPADPTSSTYRLIAQGAHPSLLHLTRPYVERDKKFRTVITVEEIRRIGRFLSMTTHDGGYRVVIVDPVDDLNINAANALLKNLEEPPSKTVFILIAHSPGRLLPTIRSRCQTIRLSPLSNEDLHSVLEGVGAELPGDANLDRAGGSARSAIMLTAFGGLEIAEAIDQTLAGGRLDITEAYRVAEAVARRGETIPFDIFNQHVADVIAGRARDAAGAGQRGLADRLASLYREIVQSIVDCETYNLDRRQHVVGTLTRLHAEMRE
jgi:DNA polymerase-3 subunit delta'